MFGREDFEKLAPVVDAFSLMTYDYSSPGRLDAQYGNISVISPECSHLLPYLIFFCLSFFKWTLVNLLTPLVIQLVIKQSVLIDQNMEMLDLHIMFSD